MLDFTWLGLWQGGCLDPMLACLVRMKIDIAHIDGYCSSGTSPTLRFEV